MNIHISLLESHDNIARVGLHITFNGKILFEHEINFTVGEMFNLKNIQIDNVKFEQNRYDIEFSNN